MTDRFTLFFRRASRLRGPLLASLILVLVGCDSTEPLNPDNGTDLGADPGVLVEEGGAVEEIPFIDEGPLLPDEEAGGEEILTMQEIPATASAVFAGGIPMGLFHLPTGSFGSRYNGALRVIWPAYLKSNLAAIKARGGKVVLSLVGNDKYSKDASGRFSLSKWKARVDRYRNVDFRSYINDGTIIGHFLLDEPNDPTNWSGTRVSGATVEEMARYSKQLWPGMATIIRAEPGYLDDFNVSYRHLDAAWAQYVTWKGTAQDYLKRNVAAAQRKGLGLVVGLNVRKGASGQRPMSASQVKSYGTTLLSSSYPCAFVSWEYYSAVETSSMKSAMDALRAKASNRSTKSCRS